MRTSTAVSTSAPTRSVRPPASITSMVPDRTGAGSAGIDGGGSLTGTKLGSGDADAERVRFVNSRRQRNSRLVCSACRRATSDTEPPGASTSARIASFCSRRHRRRVLAIISNRGEVLSPDIVPSYLQLRSVGATRRYRFQTHKAAFPGCVLSLEWFRSRTEAKVVIETWRRHYNEVRPHSSLGYLTPAEFAARLASPMNSDDAAPARATGRSAAVCGASAPRPVGPSSREGQSTATAGVVVSS